MINFDGIEDNLFSTLSENNLPKETSFNVPTDYFTNLENEILAKVSSEVKEVKVISLKDQVLRFAPIAAAASIALFIALNTFIFNKNDAISFDNLADAEIENWLTNNITLIDSDELLTAFSDLNLENISIAENSYNNQEIEDYLLSKEATAQLLENE